MLLPQPLLSFLSLSIILFVSFFRESSAEVFSITIYSEQAPPGTTNLDRLHEKQRLFLLKYPQLGFGNSKGCQPTSSISIASQPQRRASSEDLNVTNILDVEYYGFIKAGTPEQVFKVLLDTGSSVLWLSRSYTNDSQGLPSLDITTKGNSFVSSNSSTFRATDAPFNVTYGDQSYARGAIVTDTITQGNLTVADQGFALVNHTSSIIFTGEASGVMGMAFAALDAKRPIPFWQRAGIRIFSFAIARYGPSELLGSAPGGILTLGGVNTSLFTGDINYIPVLRETYWQIPLDGIIINGEQISKAHNNPAVIDTGTSLIGAPTEIADSIYSHISNPVPGDGSYQGYYFLPCDSLVQFSLAFGGKAYAVAQQDFILDQASWNRSLCRGAVFATSSDHNMWVIGDSFLRNVYTIFNATKPASIGFANPATNYQSLLGARGKEILNNSSALPFIRNSASTTLTVPFSTVIYPSIFVMITQAFYFL